MRSESVTSTAGTAPAALSAQACQPRLMSSADRSGRAASWTATRASDASGMASRPLATDSARVRPPHTISCPNRSFSGNSLKSMSQSSKKPGCSTIMSCVSESSALNAFIDHHNIGRPSSGWNCFGMSPPARIPDPPATITAYFRVSVLLLCMGVFDSERSPRSVLTVKTLSVILIITCSCRRLPGLPGLLRSLRGRMPGMLPHWRCLPPVLRGAAESSFSIPRALRRAKRRSLLSR